MPHLVGGPKWRCKNNSTPGLSTQASSWRLGQEGMAVEEKNFNLDWRAEQHLLRRWPQPP